MIESLLGLPYKIKTLLDRLTPDRAAKLDNVNDTITSRAPAASAVSNAVLTDARVGLLDNLVNLANAPVRIKSINHYVHEVLGNGAVLSSKTITPVDQTKSIILYQGCWTPSGGTCSGGVKFSGTNVLCHGNTASNSISWSFTVVEFW
mgnify:CR=1 FL=1